MVLIYWEICYTFAITKNEQEALMKKNYITKLGIYLLATFSLTITAKGAESEVLEDLRKIVKNFFQPAFYNQAEECTQTEALKQSNGQNFFHAYNRLPSYSSFDTLPFELLTKICIEIDDVKPFCQGMGLTCHRFYLVSHSIFSLNPYCLTETRPHTILPAILCTKVRNTKDGLLQLASLYSVSEENLKEWFGKDMLEGFLKMKDIPQSLDHATEEKLDEPYALFKIALAADHSVDKISPLLQRQGGAHDLSINQLRICSLRREKNYDYYNTLQWLFHKLIAIENFSLSPDHRPAGIVARDLLLAREYITHVVNHYVYKYPQKREALIQLVQWYVKNTSEKDFDSIIIHHASYLGLPELALEALQKTMLLNTDTALTQGNQNAFSQLISGFIALMKNERVQSQIKEFSSALYPQYWDTLYPHNKAQAIILMLQGGQKDNALMALADLLKTPESLIADSNALLHALSERNCSQEVVQVIQCLLNTTITPKNLSSIFNNMDYLTAHTKNPSLQSQIEAFTAKIYPCYWKDLQPYHKVAALILMLHTGQRDHIPEALSDLLSEGVESILVRMDELIRHLLKNDYHQEATQLVQLFLNSEPVKVAPHIHNVKEFFHRAIDIDREKSLTLLKACIECDDGEKSHRVYTKLRALNFLALHDKYEDPYVRKHLGYLIEKNLIDKDDHIIITSIYYHLNEIVLCHQHYQIAVEHLLEEYSEDHSEYSELLNRLEKKGLHLKSLKELKDRDPIEVINILSQ